MPTIGLTGNFGMGKSTVLSLFKQSGAITYDVDTFVHDTLKIPETIKKITRELGDEVITRTSDKISINKSLVAQIIFRNATKRKAVEKIIHPEVLRMIKSSESAILQKDPDALIIFEVPLLFEAGYDNFFDKTVVVYCNRASTFKRLGKKGFSKDEVKLRLKSQIPITKKNKRADYVINNSYGIEFTKKQVDRILKKIQTPPDL